VQQRFIAIAKSAFGCWMAANPSSSRNRQGVPDSWN